MKNPLLKLFKKKCTLLINNWVLITVENIQKMYNSVCTFDEVLDLYLTFANGLWNMLLFL